VKTAVEEAAPWDDYDESTIFSFRQKERMTSSGLA
jgi:hypothetical protein